MVAFAWNVTNSVTPGGGGGGAGTVAFDSFHVVKLLDATSPALLGITFRGTHVAEVRLDVAVRRGVTASYELSNVIIVVNERHASESGGPPLQELSLDATAVRETLTTPGGTVTSCFDLKTVGACE